MEVKDPYTKTTKHGRKKLEKKKKQEDTFIHGLRINIFKLFVLPQTIYRFSVVLIKFPAAFLQL